MTRIELTAALLLAACGPKAQPDTATPATPPATPPPQQEKAPVDPVPAEYGALTPELVVDDVGAAMDFYLGAFGAQEMARMPAPDGTLTHGELKIGDSVVMIARVGHGLLSPSKLGGTPVTLVMYVPNADEIFAAALDAGATELIPLQDMFWGDRYGELLDPAGHRWGVSTHVEDLTDEQMQQRSELVQAEMAKAAKHGKSKKKSEPVWKSVAGTPTTKPVPDEYETVTMQLTLHDASSSLDYYTKVMGGTERTRMPTPDGKLMHAEVDIGGSILMMSDDLDPTRKSAQALGGCPAMIHLYTPDVQATYDKAVAAGAQSVLAVQDMFWGDRYGVVVGPDGIAWGIATHTEDLSPEQIAERMKQGGG